MDDMRKGSGSGLHPGSAPRRFLASLVDMAIYCALSGVLFWPVFRDLPHDLPPMDALSKVAGDSVLLAHAAGIFGLWVALWWAYFIIGWGLIGGTPGQLLLGLRVVDNMGRYPIGATRAFMRLLAYCSSSLTFLFGHFLVVFRRDRRSLHDILAGTRVLRRKYLRSSANLPGFNSDAVFTIDPLESADDEMTSSHVLEVSDEEDVDRGTSDGANDRDSLGEDFFRDDGIES